MKTSMFVGLIVLVSGVLLVVWTVLAAVLVGTVNAWVLEGTFGDGWSSAWNRPLQTAAIGLIVLAVAGGSRSTSRS